MTTNPYLDAAKARTGNPADPFSEASTASLTSLAIAVELARLNDLTEAIHAPTRIAGGLDDSHGGGLDAAAKRAGDLVAGRIVAVPDEAEVDRRIAVAARRWAERYAYRNETAYVAGYHLSCSELAQVVREVDAR